MFVVIASAADADATRLVDRWRPSGARLLSPRDLSTPGWRLQASAPLKATAVIEGGRVPVGEISAILTRLPGITPADVPWIVPADRDYVAEEMTAFLLAWLSGLPCRVINAPSPTGLCGPWLPARRWAQVACDAGLRHAEGEARQMETVGTVIGDRCLGDASGDSQAAALAMARAIGVQVLAVRFDGPEREAGFVRADYTPPASDLAADALFELLSGRPA